MAVLNVNPTRMELTNLKRKLITARRGHKLLKDKRDELMRQFLVLVRECRTLRREVESGITAANAKMAAARAGMDDKALSVALMLPGQSVSIDVIEKNIMSVIVPEFDIKLKTAKDGEALSYGFAFTSADLDDAVESMAKVMPSLMELAQKEKQCQLMASEIEKTRRRVNALEHVMIPSYEDTIKYISMKLEENERSSTTRLMKIKDMMLAQAHDYSV